MHNCKVQYGNALLSAKLPVIKLLSGEKRARLLTWRRHCVVMLRRNEHFYGAPIESILVGSIGIGINKSKVLRRLSDEEREVKNVTDEGLNDIRFLSRTFEADVMCNGSILAM